MASAIPLSYELSVVLKDGAELLLPSVHPRHLPSSEERCNFCLTVWGEKPNGGDFIEYPIVMLPCLHFVGSACLGLSLEADRPVCPVCNARIQVSRQPEALLEHPGSHQHNPVSISSGTESGSESDLDLELENMPSVNSGFGPGHDGSSSPLSMAATVAPSEGQTRTSPDLHNTKDNIFNIAFTPLNRPVRDISHSEGIPGNMTTTRRIQTTPVPSIQITPPSRSQTEETEIAASPSESSTHYVTMRTLTRLDPEWYDNVTPPKSKPANHPHSKPRPISEYVWTMASVQGAIDVCNLQRNMDLDLPYLKLMVAIAKSRKGIRGREPTPSELVQALQDLYGYGR